MKWIKAFARATAIWGGLLIFTWVALRLYYGPQVNEYILDDKLWKFGAMVIIIVIVSSTISDGLKKT
jgi:hypothetical protein